MSDTEFEQIINVFSANFLREQENLEPELQKIIQDNYWELVA